MIHVPASLFELARVADPWPPRLAFARRLLVTMWLLHPEIRQRAADDLPARARAVWDVHVDGLARHGRVTVATTLVQLRSFGFVQSVEQIDDGYLVLLTKEEA